ncbi:MAG: PglZ domain-containing protein [Verrucomicrobia bacterium]|nr:PglZ domain-containing protein [Verrucomicrobiota bacterium]
MPTPVPTPRESFEQWLAGKPDSARVLLVLDSDRLLADSKGLGGSEIIDPLGRTWQLAVFRGDQIQFRIGFRMARAAGRVVVVLVGPSQPDGRVDVSLISDLLSLHEEAPLDLSLAKYLGRFCPHINFPSQPLRHYREALLARTDELAGATKKITARWGKPDDWGRPQVAALVLLAHAPNLSLDDVWPESECPAQFIADGLLLLLAKPELDSMRGTVRDLLKSTALPLVADQLRWFEPPPDEIAAFLVMRLFADHVRLQNPVAQLAGVGLLPVDREWRGFESQVMDVIARLLSAGLWKQIEGMADPYLSPKRVDRLLSLANLDHLDAAGLAKHLATIPTLTIRRALLRRLILNLIVHPAGLAEATAATSGLLASTSSDDSADPIHFGLQLLHCWQRLESTLSQPVPAFPNPAALLSAYGSGAWALIDSDLAAMHHLAEKSGDDDVVAGIMKLLFGEADHDLSPAPGSLKDRARAVMDQLDHALAEWIRPSPEAFCNGGWCSVGYIRQQLRKTVDAISLGNAPGRVWVLVFDGMRFDTWQLVARPILAEHFQIVDERPLFTVPPSYTAVARTSLLGGAVSGEWRGFQGQPTRDETTLAAVNLGLTQQDAKSKLRLIKEGETLKARAKLGGADKDARMVNVLIYGISDDCHEFYGDFGKFHQKIRADIAGDPSHGIAGILDDLLRRIQPEDSVVVVSDHGFTELLEGDAIMVNDPAFADRKDDIRWRYTLATCPSRYPDAVKVTVDGMTNFLTIGRQWFRRDGVAKSARYSHGGISMAEMVVPAVTLKRASAKLLRVVIEGVPERIEVGEDEIWEGSFIVSNRGTAAIDFGVTGVTNLGATIITEAGRLKAGEARTLTFKVPGLYRETANREPDPAGTIRAVSIRMRHTSSNGDMMEPSDGKLTIPVDVLPKTTKLDTDALAGLDNI